MHHKYAFQKNIFLCGLIFLFLAGCSSGIVKSPVNDGLKISSGQIFSSEPGRSILGTYRFMIDRDSLAAEIIPARSVASYNTIEAIDITNFLALEPCTDCVKIASVGLDPDSNIKLSIGIKHPFPAGDPTKPISGRNRADLLVFNVEGLFISDGVADMNFPITGVITANPFLMNADGYTNYLDDSLDEIFNTSADIHPYILHFADYSEGNYDPMANPQTGYPFPNPQTSPPTIPHGNLVMAQGSDFDFRDYIINPGSMFQMEFLFAVLGTYGLNASRTERFHPACRVPQHQKKAASEVFAYPLPGDGLIEGDDTSSVNLRIEVVDPGNGAPVGGGLTEMEFSSDVKTIIVEVPGIINNSIVNNNPIAVSGDGSSSASPLAYEITIYNQLHASQGRYYGLVKIVDSYPVGANDPVSLHSKDAIHRIPPGVSPMDGLADISEMATCYIFQVDVGEGNACASAYQRIVEKVVSQNVNISAGIDERCISVVGNKIYIAYKKNVTPGGCPSPSGYDLRQLRFAVSNNGGTDFTDIPITSNFCESPIQDSESLCLAANQSGNVVIGRTTNYGINIYLSQDGGSTFPSNTFLSEAQNIYFRPAIVMDSANNIFIAWINEKMSIMAIPNDFSCKYTMGNTTLIFQPSQNISDGLIYKAFSFSGGVDCDLALDSSGGVVAVWTDARGQNDVRSGTIAYDRFNGTSFGTDEIISGAETGYNGRYPSIAAGPNNDVHVAWHVPGSPGNIYVSNGTISGAFSTPQIVAKPDSAPFDIRPAIAFHSSGALHVLFSKRDIASSHEDVQSVWKCPDDLTYSNLLINYPVYPLGIQRPSGSIAINSVGDVCAIWTTNESSSSDNGELRFARFGPQ